MPWRMLEYMHRLAGAYRLPMWSVVFYVGEGAGVGDTGRHAVTGPAEVAPLVWQYQVVHLWQMPAEELLLLDQPALLALVGQTLVARCPSSCGRQRLWTRSSRGGARLIRPRNRERAWTASETPRPSSSCQR